MKKKLSRDIPDDQRQVGEAASQALFKLVQDRFLELKRTEEFTQKMLAERMGLFPPQISMWMAGPRKMSIRTAAMLLHAMGRKLELSASAVDQQSREAAAEGE